MKLEIATVLLLVLVAETQCGLIENIYDKVKNTTIGLKQDATNVLSYGKKLVGVETEDRYKKPEEETRGLIGGMIHSTREKVHTFHNYFWNSNELSEDKGVFGNLFNCIKNSVSTIKDTFGQNKDGQTLITESEKDKIIKESFNKLFTKNGTRKFTGKAFQEAIDNLRKKLREIRNKNTASTTSNPVHHGEGLIDVRAFPIIVEENINNNIGVANDIYDKVDDDLTKVSDKAADTFKNVKEGINKGVLEAKENITKLTVLEKQADTATKEKL